MSLDALFRPRAVAVFGASARRGALGHQVVHNLVEAGYTGRVIPVNPRREPVCGLSAFASLEEVPGPVDLACIAVPADLVSGVLVQCGEARVRAAVIHTAGFAESGPAGEARQQECLAVARSYGIRILGPNAQGVQNGDPSVRLYGTFTFTELRPGPVSIVAQSGGVAELLNLHLWRAGIGIRLYASPGNAADLDLPDLLEEVARDQETRVVLVHLEAVPQARRFLRALEQCREAGQEVLVLASGRHEVGRAAVSSHTGVLAAEGGLLEALLARGGGRRVLGTREAVDQAVAFCQSPRSRGNRIGVLCNAGGTGIQALESLVDEGVVPAHLSEETRALLATGSLASVDPLVDLTATADPGRVEVAVRAVLSDPGVDGLLVSLVTPFYLDGEALARAVVRAASGMDKPVVVHLLANPRGEDAEGVFRTRGIPTFPFPEQAAQAMSALVRRGGPEQERLPVMQGPALQAEGGHWLPLEEAFRLVETAGIPCAPRWVVRSPEDGLSPPIPPPWVLKADLPGGAHKARVGAVLRGLQRPEDLAAAASRLWDRFPGCALVVQPWIVSCGEWALGLVRDSSGLFLSMAGPGGSGIEDQRGLRFRLCPVSLPEAREALGSGRGAGLPGTLPQEVRGALASAWARLSRLPERLSGVLELDLNPLLWTPSGLLAVDVRLRIADFPSGPQGRLASEREGDGDEACRQD